MSVTMKHMMAMFCISMFVISPMLKAQEDGEDDELQKDIQQLLANPLRNYKRFNSNYFRGNDGQTEAVQAKLEGTLKKTEDPEAVAVLQFLLAKAEEVRFVSQKRRNFMDIRDRRMPFNRNGERPSREEVAKISKEARDSVDDSPRFARLPALITAMNKLPEKDLSSMLRRDMQRSINTMLEQVKPGQLSEKARKIIVKEYINADNDPLALFNADKVATIYKNLQIEEELKRLCETSPKEIEKPEVLLRRIQLSEAAGMEEQAIAFADELFARLGSMDAMQADRWIYELAEDYARLKPAVALEKFKELAKKHSRVYISLYRASRRIDQFGDEMRRCREWLLPCLELQKPNIEREKAYREKNKNNNNKHSVESYFYGLIFQEVDRENRLAFREPAHHNESDATLFVADYILSQPGMEKDRYYGYILYRKGVCLRRIGKLDEAKKAFQACLDCDVTEPSLKDTVNNELRRLEQK